MEKSIETIWREGFLKEDALIVPKLNDLYNQKSQQLIEKLIRKMQFEVNMLIPMSIVITIANSILGGHIVWGLLSTVSFIPFFFLGRKQLKSVKDIRYDLNCYKYLKEVERKLSEILKFNMRLTMLVLFLVLFPMLIYTYINQYGKTFGEIFGAPEIGGSALLIFLLLPIMLLVTWGAFKLAIKIGYKERTKMQMLIENMEELRGDSEGVTNDE